MRACLLGLLLISTALVVLSRLDDDSSYWLLLTGLLPLGAGMGLAMTPATAAITDALPAAKQGVGSAMNDLARELGGALGIAVLGSLLQSAYRSGMDSTGLAGPCCRAGSFLARARSRLGPSVKHQAEVAFADGMARRSCAPRSSLRSLPPSWSACCAAPPLRAESPSASWAHGDGG